MSGSSPWEHVPLDSVAETALGKMLDRGKTRGLASVPYLRNVNVQWGRIDTDDVLAMELSSDEHERFGLRAGDLLVCEGGEIGRAAIWTGTTSYMAYQKALHRVRPGSRLDVRFLRYYLQHAAQVGALDALATGSTIRHLPQQQLRRLDIPLAPIKDQRRIVDILEDHFSRLDAANASVARAEAQLATLSESALRSILGSIYTEEVRLERTLAVPLSNGRSVPTSDVGFPVLRLTALRNGRIDLNQRKIGRWSRADALPFVVAADDILVARGNGSLSLVGRAGLVDTPPDEVAFPDTMIRVRTDPSIVSAAFFALVWNSRDTRRQIEAMARTTAGIYKINQKQLGSVRLRLPSLVDQEAVLRRVNAVQDGAGRLAAETIGARNRADSLRRALLTAAFSGALTGAASDSDRIEELATRT